jgi:uncharacterized protein YjaZ
VVLSAQARQLASSTDINLPRQAASALNRINALLPGPPTTIVVNAGNAPDLIPQIGTGGYTTRSGLIQIQLARAAHSSLARTFGLWFPRDMAHEVSHSVRILRGPGVGTTLLPQIITEGIATAFDQAAFPGPPDPWTQAITRTQECALWDKAKPELADAGLYQQWMFGGFGVPHWTAFTIGYHIVDDYRNRHPSVSWAQLISTSATAILAGSHYQPCAA